MENHFPRRPAFGQVATIGTLYDARNECFLPTSFFSKALPEGSVSSTLVNKTTCKAIHDDSYEGNFKFIGVSDDFGASILAGLVVPDGAGRVLREKTDSDHVLSAVVHHQILTVEEKLDPASPGVSGCRDPLFVDNLDATHIVVEIEWGAQSAIMARSQLESKKARIFKARGFKDQVKALQKAVETGYPVVEGSDAWLSDELLQTNVMAYSSILNDGILMNDIQKYREAYEFLSVIPAHIKGENSGKGNPSTFHPLTLSSLRRPMVVP